MDLRMLWFQLFPPQHEQQFTLLPHSPVNTPTHSINTSISNYSQKLDKFYHSQSLTLTAYTQIWFICSIEQEERTSLQVGNKMSIYLYKCQLLLQECYLGFQVLSLLFGICLTRISSLRSAFLAAIKWGFSVSTWNIPLYPIWKLVHSHSVRPCYRNTRKQTDHFQAFKFRRE